MPVAAGEEEDDEGEEDSYDCVAGGHASLCIRQHGYFVIDASMVELTGVHHQFSPLFRYPYPYP